MASLPFDVFHPDCPSRHAFDQIFSRWGILVLARLSSEPVRFGVLRRSIGGISEKMLAQTLKTLERDGLVSRKAQLVIPPRVDYSLTERGYELSALLVPLVAWAFENADDIINGQRTD